MSKNNSCFKTQFIEENLRLHLDGHQWKIEQEGGASALLSHHRTCGSASGGSVTSTANRGSMPQTTRPLPPDPSGFTAFVWRKYPDLGQSVFFCSSNEWFPSGLFTVQPFPADKRLARYYGFC